VVSGIEWTLRRRSIAGCLQKDFHIFMANVAIPVPEMQVSSRFYWRPWLKTAIANFWLGGDIVNRKMLGLRFFLVVFLIFQKRLSWKWVGSIKQELSFLTRLPQDHERSNLLAEQFFTLMQSQASPKPRKSRCHTPWGAKLRFEMLCQKPCPWACFH